MGKSPGLRFPQLLFTDGSASEATQPAIAAAGWSVDMTDAAGNFVAAAFGQFHREIAPQQSSKDAEDYALRMVAFCALLPVTVGIDCTRVLQIASSKASPTQ